MPKVPRLLQILYDKDFLEEEVLLEWAAKVRFISTFLYGRRYAEISFWKFGSTTLLSTGLLQVVSTSCNTSANDKLQQPDFNGLVAT